MKTYHLIACVIAISSACGSHDENANNHASPQSANHASAPAIEARPTPQAPAVAPIPTSGGSGAMRDVLARVLHELQTRKVRMRATVTTTPNAPSKSLVVESVPPARSITLGETTTVVSGARIWTRNSPTAPFHPDSEGAVIEMRQIEEQISAALANAEGSFERLGDQAIDGHPCTIFHFAGTVTLAPATPPRTVDGHVWLGNDGLAYKLQGTVQGSSPLTIEATYEYNDSLTITLPQ
ncbi:MAG: hypothetical protein IPK60_08075 [Sandaracinaceae bacterium]|nr:hypothetical protein [Sandaracinaceae bacterium]